MITHCVVSDALRPVGAGPVEGQGVGGFGEHPYVHGRGWFRGAGGAEGLEQETRSPQGLILPLYLQDSLVVDPVLWL